MKKCGFGCALLTFMLIGWLSIIGLSFYPFFRSLFRSEPINYIGKVFLYTNSEIVISDVIKKGPYCFVRTYNSISNNFPYTLYKNSYVNLKNNEYLFRWSIISNEENKDMLIEESNNWFDLNCLEPVF